MDTPAAIPADLLDETGSVRIDLACRRCGYNLRGLTPAGRCPECGTPIGLSCHGDLLRYADPNWVEKLGRGARLIMWGILVAVLGGVLGGVLGAVSDSMAVMYAITLSASLVGFYGAWLITEPDPSGIGEDRYVTDRRIVRFALLIGLLSQVLSLLIQSVKMSGGLQMLFALAILAGRLVDVVGEFARLQYYGKLALRIPEQKLVNRARSLRWPTAICLIVLALASGTIHLVAAAARMTASAQPGTGPSPFFGRAGSGIVDTVACIGVIAGLGMLIITILILILVYRLGKAFREQARSARESWYSAGQSQPLG